MRALSGPAVSLLLALGLAGCAAVGEALGDRTLDVQTRMSDSIFLDPVPDTAARTVYVQVRNTSDKPELDIAPLVREALAARGFQPVDDPAAARYLLQANVLQAGRTTRSAAEVAYRGGFGSAIAGGVAGGAGGYVAGQLGAKNSVAVVGGALAGAGLATAADSFVQKVSYTLITDVQLAERAPSGLVVTETRQAQLADGKGATLTQSSRRTTEWRRYRTRIVSTAERANLAWADAAPQLAAGLSRSIAGIF